MIIPFAILIGYLWFLYKPFYSLSESMFWSSMELAAIRDPELHRVVVDALVGPPLS